MKGLEYVRLAMARAAPVTRLPTTRARRVMAPAIGEDESSDTAAWPVRFNCPRTCTPVAGSQTMKLSLWASIQTLPNCSPKNHNSRPVAKIAAVDTTTIGAISRMSNLGGPARRYRGLPVEHRVE